MKFAYLIEPPFNFRDKAGGVTGCDVELAKTIFEMVGIDVFDPVETEFAKLLPGLSNGLWRMTTGLFATDERRKVVAFSRPIWALADGLLVKKGNPQNLTGYRSLAERDGCVLAVIRDQFQHRTAVEFGVPPSRISLFESYAAAAHAVATGLVDAYASVGRAHSGFLAQVGRSDLELVPVPEQEKEPAFGCFAFNKNDLALREAVNQALRHYLGSPSHRSMMAAFGFTNKEIDLVASETSEL